MNYLQDEVTLQNNLFTGIVFYFVSPNFDEPKSQKFSTPKTLPLSPFLYNKPIENSDDVFAQPLRFELDTQPKSNYYPVLIVDNSRRPPNHMYEDSVGLFAATNKGDDTNPNWVVRYLPKTCLPPETWTEAVQLLHHD